MATSDPSVTVKVPLGLTVDCQACRFDFGAVYGEVAHGYIEAHHLTPLSEIPDDEPETLSPKTDFAVLCANCHRAIHRKGAPQSVEELHSLPGVLRLRGLFES